MKIDKKMFEDLLEEAKGVIFKKFDLEIDDVEISFIDKESYLERVNENPIYNLMVKKGMIKDLYSEFPSFLMVQNVMPLEILRLLMIKQKVIICDEIAKEKLKGLKSEDIKNYVIHGLVHEIVHLRENDFIELRSQTYNDCLVRARGDKLATSEFFAEDIADEVSDTDKYEEVNKILWKVIYQRMEEFSKK